MQGKSVLVSSSEKTEGPVRPSVAWLTVNRRCNFRCKWCYAQGAEFDTAQDMPIDLAVRMTRILQSAGVQHLFVTGGEPTLWNPLLKFNDFCQKIGLETTLVTNGMRFSNDAFWHRYLEHPNTFVGISLKAGNPKQLWESAQVRQFATVTRGITRAMTHFQSGVGIVYNTDCSGNLIEMAEYAMSCNAKTIKLDFCTPVFVNGEPSAICVTEPGHMVEGVMHDYPRLVEITNGNLAFIMSVPFCFWPQEFIQKLKAKNRIESVCQLLKREGIVVGSGGSLYMCNELFDFPIGKYAEDFNTAASLVELLNSPKISGYYNELSRYPSDRCQDYSWYMDCGGGCPLQWSVLEPEKLIHPIR